jgi:hypothetical protein
MSQNPRNCSILPPNVSLIDLCIMLTGAPEALVKELKVVNFTLKKILFIFQMY